MLGSEPYPVQAAEDDMGSIPIPERKGNDELAAAIKVLRQKNLWPAQNMQTQARDGLAPFPSEPLSCIQQYSLPASCCTDEQRSLLDRY